MTPSTTIRNAARELFPEPSGPVPDYLPPEVGRPRPESPTEEFRRIKREESGVLTGSALFVRTHDDYRDGVRIPVETTAEQYYESLEILPPARQSGTGFLVGEIASHNSVGIPVFTGFWRDGRNGKYYALDMTIAEFDGRAIMLGKGGAK